MSPSIYGSTTLLLTSANQDLRMFNKPEVRKVKRILFGPVDHKATQKFIDDELKKISQTKSEKWNFNFETEKSLRPDGLFDWARVIPERVATPTKRKLEEIDITDQYCKLSDADIVRPRPIKCLSPTPSSGEHRIQQSRITDFMRATKRSLSTCEVSKKQSSSDWNTDIPSKIPRLDIAS